MRDDAGYGHSGEDARRACVSGVAAQSRLTRVSGRARAPRRHWPDGPGAGSEGPATSTAAPHPAGGNLSAVRSVRKYAVGGFLFSVTIEFCLRTFSYVSDIFVLILECLFVVFCVTIFFLHF